MTTQVGDRIRLIESSDQALSPGLTGTVKDIVSQGVIVVDWDDEEAARADPALVEVFGDRWEVIP